MQAGENRVVAQLPAESEMWDAFMARSPDYDGIFWVAVKTTGIFCRPTCPARKPKRENIEYFSGPQEAMLAGYRACKRCRPLERELRAPEWVQQVVRMIEDQPDRRIRERDLRDMDIHPDRLRRWFKANCGMTFQAYARSRRLGLAFRHLRDGHNVMEAAMESGFESTSGFREAFRRVFGDAPSRHGSGEAMAMAWLETPVGPMIAASHNDKLVLLEFADRRMMEAQLRTVQRRFGCPLAPGSSSVLEQTERELAEYFSGERREFTVPLDLRGTDFQVEVWKRLLEIPYGETLSYGQMARDIKRPDAQRAVGKANGDNRIAIIIPCHRVIKSDGTLCGYGGGLWRKQRLLELETGQLPLV